MFESVLLPAPFSPSSAWTSPAAASKSTASLATTPGKRFVIPRIATAASRGAAVATESCVNLLSGSYLRDRTDDPPDEPLHRVQVFDRQALSFRDHQLALLVVERTGELVELAAHDVALPGRDLRPRLRRHLRPELRQLGEAVLDRPVVEARLPRPVDRGLHAPQVVRPPVVHGRGQPLLRRELARVGVVAHPG